MNESSEQGTGVAVRCSLAGQGSGGLEEGGSVEETEFFGGLKQGQDLGVDPGISLWPRMRVWGNCCLSAFRMQRYDIFDGRWRKMAQDWRQHPVGN